MINLDYRDLLFWYKASQKKKLEDYVKQIQSIKIGMADKKGYERMIARLNSEIKKLEQGDTQTIERNWEELKMLGGR